MGELLSVIFLLTGIYCTYSGIKKKGALYDNPKVLEENKELFTKDASKMLILAGPALTIGAVLELMKANPLYYGICYGVALALSVVLSFKINKYSRRAR